MMSMRKPKNRGMLVQTLKCMVAIKRKLTVKRMSDSSDSDDSEKSEDGGVKTNNDCELQEEKSGDLDVDERDKIYDTIEENKDEPDEDESHEEKPLLDKGCNDSKDGGDNIEN